MLNKINWKDKRIWIISAFILFTIFSGQPVEDKKVSTTEWGRVGIAVGGLVVGVGLFFVPGMQITGTIIAAVSIVWALSLGSLFSGIAGLLTPDLGIPGWAWVAGFIILFLMVVRRKKE